MYLLLSGEGSGDVGTCELSFSSCDREGFKEGPMAIIIDQLVEVFQGYEMSHLDAECVSFVSEAYLVEHKLPANRRAMQLKGKKKPAEIQYYYENARALAAAAKAKSAELEGSVVAVLFRDSDGTASAGRGDWRDKRNSMIKGFEEEGYELGVAMMPKPKSEAWLLCATQSNSYQHCERLEQESGNDKSPNSLKMQLANSLQGHSSSDICCLVKGRIIDVDLINMPSFQVFKEDLKQAVLLANSSGGIP